MIKPLIIAGGILVLIFIYLRRFLIVEKGITLSSIFFRPKNLFTHEPEHHSNELTVDEIIPSSKDVNPKDVVKADSLVKKADAFASKADLRGAEKSLISAISLDPGSVEAYKRLGMIYLRQGQYGKAEGIYRKLSATITDDPTYFSNLGMSLFSQKKLEPAKIYYKKAIELDDKRAGRFFSLGQILYELNETEEALDNFQKALSLDPNNLDYLLTLAHLYMEKEMKPEARQLLGEILLAFPDNEDAKKMMENMGEK